MKKTSLLFCSTFLFISTIFLHAGAELDYLNSLRAKAGMPIFQNEDHLKSAARNHSAYMQTNSIAGHYEESAKNGYTGTNPMERVLAADYASRVVSENVSWGPGATYKTSIDQLFSAIYHRYGFLSLISNEIGIGVSDNTQFYTYDMGNSKVNQLCKTGTYSDGSYVSAVCKDSDKKIAKTDWLSAINEVKDASPDIIVWPAEDGTDILPVFYEESPDPLPGDGVTGYPVSVEFNDQKFTTAPTVSKFTVTEVATGKVLESITLMNENNDPNSHFTEYQYALFPKKRFEWGSAYQANLTYSYENNAYTKSWVFSTRSLKGVAEKFYRIEKSTDISLNAVSCRTYAIYVTPKDTNDRLGGVSIHRTSKLGGFSYIDNNTFFVKIGGNAGEYTELTFANGQKIKLTIAANDTATVPAVANHVVGKDTDQDGVADSVDTDDDNDGILDTVEVANGLNPLDASDAQKDFDGDGFSNAIEISVGSDMKSAKIHPVWTPIIMGEIMTFAPSFN